MSPASPFNPTPDTATEAISDFSDPTLSLAEIASKHNTSLEPLALWASQPSIRERLAAVDSIALDRARSVVTTCLHTAASTLEIMLKGYILDETEASKLGVTIQPLFLESQRRHARLAALLLLRIRRGDAPHSRAPFTNQPNAQTTTHPTTKPTTKPIEPAAPASSGAPDRARPTPHATQSTPPPPAARTTDAPAQAPESPTTDRSAPHSSGFQSFDDYCLDFVQSRIGGLPEATPELLRGIVEASKSATVTEKFGHLLLSSPRESPMALLAKAGQPRAP